MANYYNNNDVEAYVKSLKENFSLINDYNTKVVSFGFVTFFAMATLVQSTAPKSIFIWAVVLMSLSIVIFVLHEIIRFCYPSTNSSNKAKAIESLPDDNLLRKINADGVIFEIRFQKWNKYFFIPSLLFGVSALMILFYCYFCILLN
jgi:hypothetical protein